MHSNIVQWDALSKCRIFASLKWRSILNHLTLLRVPKQFSRLCCNQLLFGCVMCLYIYTFIHFNVCTFVYSYEIMIFALLPVLLLVIHVVVFSRVHSNLSNCIIIFWPTNVLANSTATRWVLVCHVGSLFSRASSISVDWFFPVLFDFKILLILLRFTCVRCSCCLKCTFNGNANETKQFIARAYRVWWSNAASR